MVEKGEVMEKHKQGNDRSDQATERAITFAHSRTQMIAAKFKSRNDDYRLFMVQVQNYIVEMLKAFRILQDLRLLEMDPMKSRKEEKCKVAKSLQ